MFGRNTGRDTLDVLLKLAASAIALLAIMACNDSGEGPPPPSPTAPPGMFSTLPTDEPPIVGDQPPTIELNMEIPTATPQPTPTPNPTYTPVPTPTPDPTYTPVPTPTPLPTPTPNPTATATPVPTPTPNPTATATPVPTPTPNPTGTPIPTPMPNPTGTPIPTLTPNPTGTPYPTAAPNPGAAQTGEPQQRGTPGGIGGADANVVILADTSDSMGGSKIVKLRAAIMDFINRIEDPLEYIALIKFYDSIEVVIELDSFGATEHLWTDKVAGLRSDGGTALYDAVAHAADLLEDIGSQERSNIIIVLTDGEDTSSQLTLCNAFSKIENASVKIILFGLAYGDRGEYDLEVLEQLAAAGDERGWASVATPDATNAAFQSLTEWFQDFDRSSVPAATPVPTPARPTPSAKSSVSRTSFEASTPFCYTRVILKDSGSVWGVPTKFTSDSSLGPVVYMLLGNLKGCSFADKEINRSSRVFVKWEQLGDLSGYESETVCGKTSDTWEISWDGWRITHVRFFDESSPTNFREYIFDSTNGKYVESAR